MTLSLSSDSNPVPNQSKIELKSGSMFASTTLSGWDWSEVAPADATSSNGNQAVLVTWHFGIAEALSNAIQFINKSIQIQLN